MDYMKNLLKKEDVTLDKHKLMSKLFEMLTNQQEIKNIGKEAMKLISSIKGEVLLLQYNDYNKFNVISSFGDKNLIEDYLENSLLFKQLSDNKKPIFNSDEHGCYLALPILSKDDFLGGLFIYNEQKIDCYEELFVLLHFLALAFRFYLSLEENKLNTVKDNVTNLYNYRHFQDQLELEFEKSTRYRIPLSMVSIDIVNFSLINEKFGFNGGDAVLHEVGEIIKKTTRSIDMPSRINDDTFAILLSNTDLLGSFILLNRVLMRLERHKFSVNGIDFNLKVRISANSLDLNNPDVNVFMSEGKSLLKEYSIEDVMNIIKELNEKLLKKVSGGNDVNGPVEYGFIM